MSQAKLINGALWVLNLALGLAIAVFAWQYLLAVEAVDPFEGLTAPGDLNANPAPPARPPSDASLTQLSNPVEASVKGPGPSAPRATSFPKTSLTGVFVSEKKPKKNVAFISSGKTSYVAFIDEPVMKGGKPAPEYTGWKLSKVTRTSATFTNGSQTETVELGADAPKGTAASGGGGSGSPGAGTPYDASKFQSKLIASTDTRQIWGLDQAEIEWAKANKATLIDSSVRISMHPQGGVKLESIMAGSMAGSRGLMTGDVVRNVNGISLNGLADMQKLQNHPSMQKASTLRITLERAGKPMLLEYRPLPRQSTRRR